MTAVLEPHLLGLQEPTFLWVPEYEDTLGDEVTGLAADAGLILDPWQEMGCNLACALNPARPASWLCFELAEVVSRQNGKDSKIEALELAWLFLFKEPLIIHSAHLFETSREHFLRIKMLIDGTDDFRRRVRRMREGRGSEEIELLDGPRLKFMTRKGGAGRGFKAAKVVFNESMYLDAMMMAAMLPTLATVPNAQVLYAGSAGMKHSTQLAALRRRAYRRNDPSLAYAEWVAEKPVYGPDGELLSGDDPADPRTWAKTNPGLGRRISVEYVRKEMAAMGGPKSPTFWTERLGIGDWPVEDEAWAVIPEDPWKARCDPGSQIADGKPIALALAADPQRAMGTIGVCGLRADGKDHVEVIERHRGTGWMGPVLTGDGLADWEQILVGRARELTAKHKVSAIAVLKNSAEASLIAALTKAGLPVQSPTDVEYAQACGDFYEGVVERGDIMHIGQESMRTSVAGGGKRELPEGGWRWDPDAPADAGPVKVATLAYWARRKFPGIPRSKVW